MLIKRDILQHGIRVEKLINILKKVSKESVCIIDDNKIQIIDIPAEYSYTIEDNYEGIIDFYKEEYIKKGDLVISFDKLT